MGIDPHYFMEEMQVWEAELAFDGYRRKQYEEWARTQRLAYIFASAFSKKRLKGNDVVDLSCFDDLINEDACDVKDEPNDQPTESREEFLERIKNMTEERKKLLGLE